MPYVTAQITAGGPILDFQIGVSEPRQKALKAAELPIPPPLQIRGLIDTGASGTCVDLNCLAKLELTPTGQANILTPSTEGKPHPCNQYDISLIILHPGLSLRLGTLPVVESDLASQGIQALIGRDVLKRCLFTYNGSEETFAFAF